jgi:hypothetical protein
MFEMNVVTAELQAELARLRADGHERALSELVDLVGACQAVVNRASALQTLAMAHLAAIEDVAREDGTVVEQHRGLGHQRLDAPALVSDQLGVSDAAAGSRVGAAVDVVTRLPGLLAAMGAGRLDEYGARVVSDELREVPTGVCAQVVARITDSLGTEPPAALRRRVRQALASVDADLVRTKAARARSERSLRRWPGDEPGVDTWLGSFPAEQSRSGWAVVDGLARQYVREGKVTTVEQARADALMDLIHARATGTFAVQLAVPADRVTEMTPSAYAAAAADDELVTVTGLGMPGSTQVRRAWLESLIDTAPPTGESRLARPRAHHEVVACHADTGALLSIATDARDLPGRNGRRGRTRATESRSYRPPQALIDLVKARDGRCRFPGCTVNARSCDLDHVLPWPLGPTHPSNLVCLCRRHHRVKQTVGWHVRLAPDATLTWTDPTGRARTTLPLDFLQADLDALAPRRALPPTARAASEHVPGMRTGQAPADTPAVLWSAWEEELAHQVAAAERALPRRRGEPGCGGTRPSGGRSGWGSRADEQPPF